MSVDYWTSNPERPMFVVDWDGTCVAEEWPGMGDWLPGAVFALSQLAELGTTVIYSVRCSLTELDATTPRDPEAVKFETDRVRAKLDSAGLTYIGIYPPDRGKPAGKYFIDDRAVAFTDWSDTMALIMMKERYERSHAALQG